MPPRVLALWGQNPGGGNKKEHIIIDMSAKFEDVEKPFGILLTRTFQIDRKISPLGPMN